MRTVTLTERRSAVRRLPRADADDLLAGYRHVVELLPTADRGVYRLTARGWAGVFRTRRRVWHVRPKLGWAAVRTLFDAPPSSSAADDPAGLPAELAALLAVRLAGLMDAVSAGGLVRGYAEAEVESATVRGRIDLPRTAREDARGTGRLFLRVDEFTLDVPWNQLPAAAARRLLTVPGLPPAARVALDAALRPFATVSDPPSGRRDWPDDPRTRHYRPLLDWTELVMDSVGAGPAPTLLVNLEQLFEAHVTGLLTRRDRNGWSVQPQQPIRLTSPAGLLELIPDLVVHDPAGRPAAVWDTKWKRVAGGPDPADVHQVLAYAAALGVSRAGLIYPGRRFTARTYGNGLVRLTVLTHRLTGDPTRVRRVADRLVRAVFRSSGLAGRAEGSVNDR